MYRRAALVPCVLALLAIPLALNARNRPIVAVFEVQTKRMKLSKARRNLLTELMASELGLRGYFKIMPPGDVKSILLGHSKESYKKCYDEKCQIELGRQLPANKLVTATVMRMGANCRVSASLYDLKTQTTDTTVKVKGGCTEGDLMSSVEKVAADLRAWAGEPASSGTGVSAGVQPGAQGALQELHKEMENTYKTAMKEDKLDAEKLLSLEKFAGDYPDSNPYLKAAEVRIRSLRKKLNLPVEPPKEGAWAEPKVKHDECWTKRSECVADCEVGHAERCEEVGRCLSVQKASLLDLEKALYLTSKGCGFELKSKTWPSSRTSCWRIGLIYMKMKLAEKAVVAMERACKVQSRCGHLGSWYWWGNVVERDKTKAVEYMKMGCGIYGDECRDVARAYWLGEGVPIDLQKAKHWYLRGCKQAKYPDSVACDELQTLQNKTGAPLDVKRIQVEMRKLALKAAKQCKQSLGMRRMMLAIEYRPNGKVSQTRFDGTGLHQERTCISGKVTKWLKVEPFWGPNTFVENEFSY
jgi:hypothetical protein